MNNNQENVHRMTLHVIPPPPPPSKPRGRRMRTVLRWVGLVVAAMIVLNIVAAAVSAIRGEQLPEVTTGRPAPTATTVAGTVIDAEAHAAEGLAMSRVIAVATSITNGQANGESFAELQEDAAGLIALWGDGDAFSVCDPITDQHTEDHCMVVMYDLDRIVAGDRQALADLVVQDGPKAVEWMNARLFGW